MAIDTSLIDSLGATPDTSLVDDLRIPLDTSLIDDLGPPIAPAEATAVAPTTIPEPARIGQSEQFPIIGGFPTDIGSPQAGLSVPPNILSVDNPDFGIQSPEDQLKSRVAMMTGGVNAVLEAGLQPETFPHGNIAGFLGAFGSGVTGEPLFPVQGASPLATGAGEFLGATERAGITVGAARAIPGIQPLAAEALGGLGFGAIREAQEEQTEPFFGKGGAAEGATLDAILFAAAPALVNATRAGRVPTQSSNRSFSQITPEDVVRDLEVPQEQLAKAGVPDVGTDIPQSVVAPQATFLNTFGVAPEQIAKLKTNWATGVDNATKRTVALLPDQITTAVRNFWVGPAPAEFKNLLKQTDLNKQVGQRLGNELGASIRENIPKEFQLDAFKTLDPTAFGDLGTFGGRGLSKAEQTFYRDIIGNARNKIDELGAEMVGSGLLDEATYAKNVGEYLSRYYKPHIGKELMIGLGRKFRGLSPIKGRQLKRRRLKTIAQREKAGLITDPSYAVARTVGDLTYDLETAKMLRTIASKPEWTSPQQLEGYVGLSNDKKWGDLAGQWIRKDIFDEVKSVVETRTEWGKFYDKMLGSWKFGKTALNPATHGRNIFSNVILSDFAGLSPLRVDIYMKAGRDYFAKGKFYQEAQAEGLLGSDWFGSEVSGLLKSTGKGSGSFINRMWDVAAENPIPKALGKAGDLYQGEEHFFKMAVFVNERLKGATPAQASAHAQKFLFNYAELSPALKKLRRSPFGGPFLSFTAKSLPVIAETAVKQPLKFGKYYAGFKLMNEISKKSLGISDEEYAKIKRSLPPWQRSGWQLLLPFKGKDNKPLLADLTYNLPWGDLAEQGNLIDVPVAGPIVEKFIGSNPLLRTPLEAVFNKSLFLDKPITTKGERLLGQAPQKQLEAAFRSFAPGFLANAPAVAGAIRGDTTKAGDVPDLVSTLLSKVAGIKVTALDVERGLDIKVSQAKKDVDAIVKTIISTQFDQSLSREDKKKIVKDSKVEIDKIKDKIRKIRSGKQKPRPIEQKAVFPGINTIGS